jgi:DNA-nicking Smr family endonuclease
MNIVWSPEATEDPISLRAYCGRRSYYRAAGRAAHHTERRELLPDNPQIGRAGRVPGTREFAIPRDTLYRSLSVSAHHHTDFACLPRRADCAPLNSHHPPSGKKGVIEVIKMEIDLHGYHPSEIVQTDVLKNIIQQTWDMGITYLTLIHGHGRNRGISPGFVNTNTGYFGLEIRRALRHDNRLRFWIKHTTLDCSHMGTTSIKLKPNPTPTRSELDQDLLP